MADTSCNLTESCLQTLLQQAGTTLTATVSATGHFTRTFAWTINKSVTPTIWNLFTGDTGISRYTIAVTKSSGVDAAWVDGQVCVTNGGAVATENLIIVANLTMPPSTAVIASVNVDVSQHPVLQPGETFCYNYRIDIPTASIVPGGTYKVTADITITNHSGHIGTPFGPSPSATTILPASPTPINDTIHVDDTNGMSFTFSTSGSQTYDKQYTCENTGTNTNTATIRETGQQSSASVTVNCYSLEVSKTANTSFTRTFNWNINKFAEQTSLTLSTTEQFTVNYEIDVNATFTDSNFAVNGSITVHNPAPVAATINSLSDIVGENIMADVTCINPFPMIIPAGSDLVCTYTTSLPDALTRTNTATATLQNFIYDPQGGKFADGTTNFSGSAPVDFSNAMITKIDDCVDVSDTAAGTLGTVCFGVDTLPKAFTYSRIIGPFSPCGEYTVSNTASFITKNTGSTGSSSWTVNVHVPCEGCTLTIGYWKTHAGFGPSPQKPDAVTPLLPIWLGTPGGAKSINVETASMAVDILNMNVLGTPSNGITKLYAQLLAAKLNQANGADVSSVASTISAADAFLATHNYLDWAGLSRADKNMVLGWVTTLDNYNTGIIGPGHCSEQ